MSSLRITSLFVVPASALIFGLLGCSMETADTPEEAAVGQAEEGLTPTEEAVPEDGQAEETAAVPNENGTNTEWHRFGGWRGGGFGLGWGGLGFRGLGFRGLGFRGLGFRGLGYGYGYPGFGYGYGYPGFGYGLGYGLGYGVYPYYGLGAGCYGVNPCLF